MDNEYTEGIWEHEIAFTTAPGTEWTWRRCFAVGGKTNFWGRSSARFGDIDFRAASRDGYDVDWPITYEEIAPYYSRVERMIGVASTVQEPAQQSGRRVSAADELPLHRSHPRKRRAQGRHPVSAGPNRAAYRAARRASRLPLLRQLHGRLRVGRILLDALVFSAGRGEERQSRSAHQCAVQEHSSGRKRPCQGRRLHRPHHEAGGRGLCEGRGSGGVLRRVGAHCVEFEIAPLAERDRQFQRPGGAQSLRSSLRHHCPRLLSAIARAAQFSR